MCGRYVMAKATSDLVAAFAAEQAVGEDLAPSWNVAPTDDVRIVTERARRHEAGDGGAGGDTVRRLTTAKWGLVPAWAKDPKIGARMINARRETVLEKPSFRKAAVKRRALVPADGYYEWEKSGGTKIPTYLYSPAEDPLAFAGLYEFWPDPALPEDHEHKWLLSVTIITTEASDALGHIHDRTPLIVPPDMYADWLDPRTTQGTEVQQLLDAMPEPVLTPRVVSPLVNSVRNNGAELILPADAEGQAGGPATLPGL
ncbi:SOS response-associated peptidase [Arthrobacter jiangjiafuii]|uniref:Abasic site processing protein n=1 Tax=Arthrobacter jiangjiafuii TaxID=2817475 RepID=A0A975M300_9MICC|nr:SOS response-associated peptidase [Arthrobacter jiangjiafuii]MBP3043443.1 SOS response-associated peptidase [Arthrobacter jiangjiafuii]QWC08970.1 SOS response-associated peptidase [Arthrobacter jiangjiafuii]